MMSQRCPRCGDGGDGGGREVRVWGAVGRMLECVSPFPTPHTPACQSSYEAAWAGPLRRAPPPSIWQQQQQQQAPGMSLRLLSTPCPPPAPQWMVVGSWYMTLGGWWLVVGGWWLAVIVVVGAEVRPGVRAVGRGLPAWLRGIQQSVGCGPGPGWVRIPLLTVQRAGGRLGCCLNDRAWGDVGKMWGGMWVGNMWVRCG